MRSSFTSLMAFAAAAFLLLAYTSSVQAATSECAFKDGDRAYDFSSLTDRDWFASDSQFNYNIHFCGNLTDHASPECQKLGPDASACLISGYTQEIGDWPSWDPSSVEWGYIDSSKPELGVGYKINGRHDCYITRHSAPFVTYVHFECASEAGSLRVSRDGCAFTFTYPTPLACSNPPPTPKCGFKDGNNTYDFSSLTGSDLLADDGSYKYNLHVCNVLSEQAAPECLKLGQRTAACQIGAYTAEIGDWPTDDPPSVNWSYIDPSQPERGVGYTMTGARACWVTRKPDLYVTNVNFECASESGPLRVHEGTMCIFNFTYPTPLACPSSSSHFHMHADELELESQSQSQRSLEQLKLDLSKQLDEATDGMWRKQKEKEKESQPQIDFQQANSNSNKDQQDQPMSIFKL